MKKLTFILLLAATLMCPALTADAQNNDGASIAKSKTYIQAGVGANFACDNFTATKKLIGATPAFDFAFGYRPIGGLDLRLGYEGFQAKREDVKFNWGYAHLDAMWGITDMKKTALSCRHFVARPYLTAGAAFANVTCFAYGIGLVIGGRFSYHCELVADARAVKISNRAAFPGGSGICGNASATLNFIYHF